MNILPSKIIIHGIEVSPHGNAQLCRISHGTNEVFMDEVRRNQKSQMMLDEIEVMDYTAQKGLKTDRVRCTK